MELVAVIFDNLGPYHLARLGAASACVNLTAIQVCGASADYAWDNTIHGAEFPMATLFPADAPRKMQESAMQHAMIEALDRCNPAVVVVPGWAGKATFSALSWCIRHGVPIITMSESTAWDEQRVWWKEFVKRQIVGLYSAALVGGRPHADYMKTLGMPQGRIFLGYDTVDNAYFSTRAAHVRGQEPAIRAEYKLPAKYFLASARFIEKKNLARLIEAYARYRSLADSAKVEVIWELVLLGDGALRQELEIAAETFAVTQWIHMPGFKQYPELPVFYGLAGAFLHASTTEQWGLVVNEAMASGLPVLISSRCGCTQDLVQEGVNGHALDPHNIEEMARRMFEISTLGQQLAEMGEGSQRIISHWGPERFAAGLKSAVEKALEGAPVKPSLAQSAVLQFLLRR